MGNLKDNPMTKNVLKQFSYEYRKSTLEDEDAVKSIRIIEGKYSIELAAKSVPGFIQYFSINTFTIALWTDQDIELYHKMTNCHSLLVDATGSIATKINGGFHRVISVGSYLPVTISSAFWGNEYF